MKSDVVKERPILFNADMVRAILEGRKTQTRRPVKPQPTTNKIKEKNSLTIYSEWKGASLTDKKDWFLSQCPYGHPGDRLWVRETFALESTYENPGENLPTDGRPVKKVGEPGLDESELFPHYRATEPDCELWFEDDESGDPKMRWTPSIHMPRWASRILLEITNIRVERVQQISEKDAWREGRRPHAQPCGQTVGANPSGIERFADSWNRIYPGSWDRNDWVWVVEFKVVNS